MDSGIIERMWEKLGLGKDKKMKEKAIILVVTGAAILLAGNILFSKPAGKKNVEKSTVPDNSLLVNTDRIDDASAVEVKLKEILSSIAGAGNCKVMITYASTEEIIPFVNKNTSEGITDEKDSSGGARKSTNIEIEESIILEEASGARKPAISKKVAPKAVGAVVVCPGGDNPNVKEAVSKTLQALFDLPAHKIHVIKGS